MPMVKQGLLVGLLLTFMGACAAKVPPAQEAPLVPSARPLFLAHYMPWYENKAESGKWGWHWTMNHFNPDRMSGGRQQAASKYRPLLGLYDSGDPALLECHVLLMKLAGLDGAIVDWYGLENYYDYVSNHRHAQQLIKLIERAGMKFAIIYEDGTVNELLKGNVYGAGDAVNSGKAMFSWMENNWFNSPSYVKLDGRPVLLVFGPQHYKDEDWPQMFDGLKTQPDFFTLMFKRGPAVGGFSWPTPQKGEAESWNELDMFAKRGADWKSKIEVAYPRFDDIYKEAGLNTFPMIEDRGGQVYERTLTRAVTSRAPIIQLATWNDWGEGTQIEPSEELGYRDLEITLKFVKAANPGFSYVAADLRLPVRIYMLRKKHPGDRAMQAKLDAAASSLYAGDVAAAKKILTTVAN